LIIFSPSVMRLSHKINQLHISTCVK
jgi:hypothetical protein